MTDNTWVRKVIYNNDPLALTEAVESFGFAKFNNNDHVCLDLSDDEKITITIKLKDGKKVTFAVLPQVTKLGTYLGMHCIDIVCAGKRKQPWILHGYGYPVYHVADSGQEDISMGTLLLADEYYEDQEVS